MLIEIRSFRQEDLGDLYQIAVLTGHAGDDATGMYDDPKLLGHVFVAPYTINEPDLAFVAVDASGVAGYAIGSRDARVLERALETGWWHELRNRYPYDAAGTDPDQWLIERIHRPATAPDEIVDRYPSEFHIDLLPRCQGHGVGRQIIDRLLMALRQAGSPGVHCGVDPRNLAAIGFYQHLGFERIDTAGPPIFVRTL